MSHDGLSVISWLSATGCRSSVFVLDGIVGSNLTLRYQIETGAGVTRSRSRNATKGWRCEGRTLCDERSCNDDADETERAARLPRTDTSHYTTVTLTGRYVQRPPVDPIPATPVSRMATGTFIMRSRSGKKTLAERALVKKSARLFSEETKGTRRRRSSTSSRI